MPMYQYRGKDKFGETIEGRIDSPNETTVVHHLQRLQIIPIDIQKTQKHYQVNELPRWIPLGRPSESDLSMFARQMHSMLKAQVPINRALQVVTETTKNQVLRNALTHILLDLESGYALALCFSRQGYIFHDFFTAMVEVGENTGKLDEAFLQIHNYLEIEITTKKRIRGALRYPILVVMAIIGALIAINFFVVPAFVNFFESMQATLPLATRFLMALSAFCLNHAWTLFAVSVLSLGGWLYALHHPKTRFWWDRFKLRIPLVGSIMHRSIMARFARSLAMAHQSGLPLLEAIEVVAKSADNRYMTDRIVHMTHRIRHGDSFAFVAKKSKLFSPLTVQMLTIAEETGQLNENLLEVAEFYEQDVDHDIKRLNELLEPVLIAIIAAMVLVLALGVFLPLWDLSAVAMQKVRS